MIKLKDVITIGDTLDFTTSVPDFPASEGWTLKYRLTPRLSTQSVITITASAVGEDYRVQVPASATALYEAGWYTANSFVEMGSERYTVGERVQVQIRASSAAMAAGTDGRTAARVALDAIDAVIANRATMDQQEYQIAGRSLKRMTVDDLLKLRDRYAAIVRKERRDYLVAAGNPDPKYPGVKFVRP